MKSIFVLGAYTDTNKQDLEIYTYLSSYLKNRFTDYEIIDPFVIENYRKTLTENVDEEMVRYDLNCVKKASLLVADLTNKSTGVGIELGIALEHSKSVILLAKKGSNISNMIKGAFAKNKIFYYEDIDDICNILSKELDNYDL